jgi:NAD+ diphosphatase
MEMNFCYRCGSKLTRKNASMYTCAQGHTMFDVVSPAACALLLNAHNEVLLAVRGIDPGKGRLDVPGGFCNAHESLHQAITRELHEELGLNSDDYSELTFLHEGANNYLYEGETKATLVVIFWGYIKEGAVPVAGDDAVGYKWIPLAEVDVNKLPENAVADQQAVIALQKHFGLVV